MGDVDLDLEERVSELAQEERTLEAELRALARKLGLALEDLALDERAALEGVATWRLALRHGAPTFMVEGLRARAGAAVDRAGGPGPLRETLERGKAPSPRESILEAPSGLRARHLEDEDETGVPEPKPRPRAREELVAFLAGRRRGRRRLSA